MSSALNYRGLSLALCADTLIGPINLNVLVIGRSGVNRRQQFKVGGVMTPLSRKAMTLHLSVVSWIFTERFLTKAVWQKSKGPTLLHKAIVRAVHCAYEGNMNESVLEIDTAVAADAVALCWSSNSDTGATK